MIVVLLWCDYKNVDVVVKVCFMLVSGPNNVNNSFISVSAYSENELLDL